MALIAETEKPLIFHTGNDGSGLENMAVLNFGDRCSSHLSGYSQSRLAHKLWRLRRLPQSAAPIFREQLGR
jgi:hypothetical protein